MCKTFERLTQRKLGLQTGALAQCQITDNADHRRCGKSRCGHLVCTDFPVMITVIPVVSTCKVRSKKNRKGCQKNESFQGSFPSPGDIVTNRKYSQRLWTRSWWNRASGTPNGSGGRDR